MFFHSVNPRGQGTDLWRTENTGMEMGMITWGCYCLETPLTSQEGEHNFRINTFKFKSVLNCFYKANSEVYDHGRHLSGARVVRLFPPPPWIKIFRDWWNCQWWRRVYFKGIYSPPLSVNLTAATSPFVNLFQLPYPIAR